MVFRGHISDTFYGNVNIKQNANWYALHLNIYCESSGQQSGHPSAGAADGRRPVGQGEDHLSSDKETQQQDSTYPNT